MSIGSLVSCNTNYLVLYIYKPFFCVSFPELYKEYRDLKRAKENNISNAAGGHAQSNSAAEVNTVPKVLVKKTFPVHTSQKTIQPCTVIQQFIFYCQIIDVPDALPLSFLLSFCLRVQESDCWGAHLNRSSLPVASPKLTPEDRDGIKASAQYYGLKLKTNLATLVKVRHTVSKPKTHSMAREKRTIAQNFAQSLYPEEEEGRVISQ